MRSRFHIRVLAVILTVCAAASCADSFAQRDISQAAYQLTVDGSNLIRAGNSTLALSRLQQAYALTPNSWDVSYYTAVAYETSGDLADARSWFQRAYNLDPSRHEAIVGLARVFYAQKDYKNALPILERLTLNHPATETTYNGYLALAKCYAETGRVQDFENALNKALSIKSSDPSAWLFAAQELDCIGQTEKAVKYYSEYVKRFPGQPNVADVDKRIYLLTYQEDKVERLKEINDAFVLHSDTEDLKDFVQIVDPKNKGVSQTAIAQVLLGLSEIPRTYRHQLQADGFKVVVTPDLLDAMPELAGQTPRGYADGASWHSSHGATDRIGKRIIIAETIKNPQPTPAALDKVAQHEFGHAYDLYAGIKQLGKVSTNPFPEVSHSKIFSDAYEKDAATVPDSLKSKLAYYLQPGDAGKEELFAQMFVLFFGPRPEPGSPRESFQTAFPSVITVLHNARRSDPDFDRLQALYEAKFQDNILSPQQRVQKILQDH